MILADTIASDDSVRVTKDKGVGYIPQLVSNPYKFLFRGSMHICRVNSATITTVTHFDFPVSSTSAQLKNAILYDRILVPNGIFLLFDNLFV